MSSKWTIEKIFNCEKIKLGTYLDYGQVSVGNPLSLVIYKNSECFKYTSSGEELYHDYDDEAVEDYKFYDQDMNLIEPPKEREFEIIVECMNNQSLKTEFFSDADIIHGYTKLPNGRRYKCYKDNGELEVIENE